MINRLPRFNISGLPESEHQDLISYLKSLPEFNKFEAKMHLDSPDGSQTKIPGSISASLELSCINAEFIYRNYLIGVTVVLGEIYIVCEQVTQKILFDKYRELQERAIKLRKVLDDFNVNFQMAVVDERFRINHEYKERFKENKRQIKEELIRMGIEVKPGSNLSKLLRLDYLPFKISPPISSNNNI
ncbi:MAG: hypothetical protein NTZ48_07070 [Candidatus Omnitrophica bacterium]|nr:hypothetical protein [Candidatus Omnitrophota bacterium]